MRPSHARSCKYSLCLALLLAVATAAATPHVSRAEDVPSQRASGSAAYQELIDEAVAEFRRGNYPEAYSLFERAHAVQPNARTLRGMGLAAFEERRYVACIQHLRAALKDRRKPLTAEQRAHAEEVIQRASGFVAQYTLELSPADARVTVDSHPATVVEGMLLLDPGQHEIVVSVEGHQETRYVRARPNDNVTLRIKLTARAPSAGPTLVEEQDSWFSPVRKTGTVLAGTGAAALVTSLALTLRARAERDGTDCNGGSCPSAAAKDQYEGAVTLSKAATATAVVGSVLAATGVTLLLWQPRESRDDTKPQNDEQARLGPALGRGYAGLSLAGRF